MTHAFIQKKSDQWKRSRTSLTGFFLVFFNLCRLPSDHLCTLWLQFSDGHSFLLGRSALWARHCPFYGNKQNETLIS